MHKDILWACEEESDAEELDEVRGHVDEEGQEDEWQEEMDIRMDLRRILLRDVRNTLGVPGMEMEETMVCPWSRRYQRTKTDPDASRMNQTDARNRSPKIRIAAIQTTVQ